MINPNDLERAFSFFRLCSCEGERRSFLFRVVPKSTGARYRGTLTFDLIFFFLMQERCDI